MKLQANSCWRRYLMEEKRGDYPNGGQAVLKEPEASLNTEVLHGTLSSNII